MRMDHRPQATSAYVCVCVPSPALNPQGGSRRASFSARTSQAPALLEPSHQQVPQGLCCRVGTVLLGTEVPAS